MKQKLYLSFSIFCLCFIEMSPSNASIFRGLSLVETAIHARPMLVRAAEVFEKSRGYLGTLPGEVTVVEVGPRDGLQNQPEQLSVSQKVKLIGLLRQSGLRSIEGGSFVSPCAVPQMAGSDEVAKHLMNHRDHPAYPFLVPNMKGLEKALEAGVKEVAVFTSPSEKFLARNIHMGVEESLAVQGKVVKAAISEGLDVRGYVSCVMACPYEGVMDPNAVVNVTQSLLDTGCYEVSLGDTIGVGNLALTNSLLECLTVDHQIPVTSLAAHFHNTNGWALQNILLALMYGITTVDASIAGLGSCPYADGATGNVDTEDLVSLLHGLGVETGVGIHELEKARLYIEKILNKT